MRILAASGDKRGDLLDFTLPAELEASEPAEARGLARDEVRLMVSYRSDNRVIHTRFRELGAYLEAGDLLVINTSGTMNAALNANRADGTACELHLSTHLPADIWVVEVRLPTGTSTVPLYDIEPGETLQLAGGAMATLHTPYAREHGLSWRGEAPPLHLKSRDQRGNDMDTVPQQDDPEAPAYGGKMQRHRLWIASLHLPSPLQDYLARYGFPIRYGYVKQQWPISYYQSVYTTEIGSAEMPSAGRAFTPELITRLVAHGVQIAPLILHTGVASLEAHEPPYEEYYRVPLETARLVNMTRKAGRRVVAVGTTVVRALETVTDSEGTAHPGEGWTSLVITPQRGMRAVSAMLTGLHEPRASHLAMLEALCGREHLKITYQEALGEGYLWHEFGDLHLILP